MQPDPMLKTEIDCLWVHLDVYKLDDVKAFMSKLSIILLE